MSFTVFSLRAAAVPGFCQNQGSGGTKTDRQPDRQIKVAKFWLSKSKKNTSPFTAWGSRYDNELMCILVNI